MLHLSNVKMLKYKHKLFTSLSDEIACSLNSLVSVLLPHKDCSQLDDKFIRNRYIFSDPKILAA